MKEQHIHNEGAEAFSYTCEIHKDAVKELSKNMPDGEFFLRIADFFKIFGDPTRAKIIYTLEGGELCVRLPDSSVIYATCVSIIEHN